MAGPQHLSKYDTALLGILQHEGELEPFLDVVFGFLFRKTDFYHVMTDTQKKYGFPPGVSEKLIMKHFKKYSNLTAKMVEQAGKQKNLGGESLPEPTSKSSNAESEPVSDKIETQQKPVRTKPAETKVATSETPNPSSAKLTPIQKTQEEYQSNPESYNGAVRDKYTWSQNYDDIDVIVPVAKTITKGRQVKVTIEKKHLFVSVTDIDGKTDTIMDGDLKHEILREDSMWSLEGSKNIQITLAKDTKFWWNALLMNEDEIDVQKIAPERSMADMQEDEVAVINKLQFDEKQKRLGLPQSHELKVHEMLKKGWDAEGSPFKGQDFDPKMFNISPSGVQ
uniref:nudC domain-containing protein 3-like n=1 Tax=Styela clava TaxID=7725 RepID=UPI0019396ED3|nr:nudC domain-containing protein 3-like [Styela clava]